MRRKWMLAVLFLCFLTAVGFCIWGVMFRPDHISTEDANLASETTQVIPVTTSPTIAETTEQEPVIMEANKETTASETRIPWYEIGRFVYHATGSIDGVGYTNSCEALEATLSKGNMLVEIDFRYTTDNHLVCVHKWKDFWGSDSPCNLSSFLEHKIRGKYSGLTGEAVIAYMEEYPSLYVIVDTKEEDFPSVVGELLRLCDNRPEIADRFVIQLYDRGEKEKITALYPFPQENFLFTCYKFGSRRTDDILALCHEENISVVTFQNGSWDQKMIDRFLDEGFVLFTHTVNSVSMVEQCIQKGIYGFYTDCVQESELAGSSEW